MISFPTPPYDGSVISWHDKVFHVVLFGVFVYLAVSFFVSINQIRFSISILSSALLAAAYSWGSELIQVYVPGRTVSIYDFYAGLTGISIALIIAYVRFRKKT